MNERVDWFKVFAQLNRAGISARRAAREIGVSQASVMGYVNRGIEPRHREGELIVALWCQHTAQERADVPRLVGSPPRYRRREAR